MPTTIHPLFAIDILGKTGYVLAICLVLALIGAWVWHSFVQTDMRKWLIYGIAALLAVMLTVQMYTLKDSHHGMDQVLCYIALGIAAVTLYRTWHFRKHESHTHKRLTIAVRCLTFFTFLVLAADYRLYADPQITHQRSTGLAAMTIETLSWFVLASGILVLALSVSILAGRFKHEHESNES